MVLKNGKDISCKVCKEEFYVSKSRMQKGTHPRKFCSRKCQHKDSKGKTFNTGRTHFKKGHELSPKFKYKTGKIRMVNVNGRQMTEHKYVWLKESEWGFIPYDFVLHHVDGNVENNAIENLACIQRSWHVTLHNHIRKEQAMGGI